MATGTDNSGNSSSQPNRPTGSPGNTQQSTEPPEIVANAAVQLQQAQQVMFERANEVKAKAASQLFQAATTLRSEMRGEQGQSIPQAEALAANLEQLGHYLEAHSFDEIERDARQTIQRNPWQSVGVAVAVGWILSRIFAPRHRR